MRRTRNKQIMTIAIVMVAVVGLSIGFAVFSANLSIQPNVAVKPNASDFSVVFSKTQNTVSTDAVTPTYSFTSPAEKNPTASNGTIDNSGNPKITNLIADFTEPGQTVTYEFYVRNEGEYLTYLNNINIGEKSCVKTEGSTAQQSLVNSACNSISASVKVGNLDETTTSVDLGQQNITHTLSTKTSEKVIVTLTYASSGTRVDGPFSVTFGNVELIYSTVEDYTPVVKDDAYFGLTLYNGGMVDTLLDYNIIGYKLSQHYTPTGFYLNNINFANEGIKNDSGTYSMSNEEFINTYGDYLAELGEHFYTTHDDSLAMGLIEDSYNVILISKTSGFNTGCPGTISEIKIGNYYISAGFGLC